MAGFTLAGSALYTKYRGRRTWYLPLFRLSRVAATPSTDTNAIFGSLNVCAFIVSMPIDSLKELMALMVSSIFVTSTVVGAYGPFLPSRK